MYIFFRKDRISNLKTIIPKLSINKNMGWCNDPKSKKYNKLIRFPYKYSAEKLYRRDFKYDLLIPISYNRKKKVIETDLHSIVWDRIIIDESQYIRNKKSKRAKAALLLNSIIKENGIEIDSEKLSNIIYKFVITNIKYI